MIRVKAKEVKDQKQLSAKELLEKMRRENENLYDEIASFVDLLQEYGVTSYKLTGSIQEPIITNYSIS